MTAAIVITGAPGAGKSSVAEAFTTLLDNAGIEHGAIESEQLAWGTPWLEGAQALEQLAAVLALQRGYGRRLFVVVATTETGGSGRAAGGDRRRAVVRGGAARTA